MTLKASIHAGFRGLSGTTNERRCVGAASLFLGPQLSPTLGIAGRVSAFFPAHHNNASNPFRSSKFSSLSDGPLGCFSPISHLRTVEALVLSTEAITV